MTKEGGRPGILAVADALIWSSLWLALAVAALTVAAARAMEVTPEPAIVGLAFTGTIVVYVLDRLRDLPRDAQSDPLRSAFIRAHGAALRILVGGGALASVFLGVLAGPSVILLAALVLWLGLLHRRLKRWIPAKPLYVALSCTAVTVGFSWVRTPAAGHALWVAGVVTSTAVANVLLYNLRQEDGLTASLGGTRRTRLLAAACLGIALGLTLLGGTALRPLAWLPVAMAASLLGFRPTERYAAWAVDGALLLGALLAILTPAT